MGWDHRAVGTTLAFQLIDAALKALNVKPQNQYGNVGEARRQAE
jgi:hypothetical protein